MNEGWISLHRQIQDNFLWKDKPFAKGQAWVDLLLLAYHEDTDRIYRGELKHYKRGEVHTSFSFLAERWGWGWRKVRRFIAMLEETSMVTLSVTTHDTTITIVNYSFFQGEGRTNSRTDSRTEGRTDSTQSIMINNSKNDNNTRQRRGTSYAERKRKEREELDELIIKQAKEDIAEWHKEYPGEPLPPEMVELCERFSINYSEI